MDEAARARFPSLALACLVGRAERAEPFPFSTIDKTLPKKSNFLKGNAYKLSLICRVFC